MTTFLTTAQAADFLGLSPKTLRAWRMRGGGPPYTRMSPTATGMPSWRSHVRYRRDDLETFVRERRFTSTAEETERARVLSAPQSVELDRPPVKTPAHKSAKNEVQ